MKNKLIIGIVALLAILASCKEKIDLKVADADPLLVVEGEISTETDSSNVKLSLSSNYFSKDEPNIVTTAAVSVNGVAFNYNSTEKAYLPAPGYVGKADSTYELTVSYNGRTYKASCKIEPMFKVDSFFQTKKKAEGFLPEGYSVSYVAYDARQPIKYTYFQQWYFDKAAQKDSFPGRAVIFDNSLTPFAQTYNFEVPLARFQSGDIYHAVFRSVETNMRDYILAFQNQNPSIPGPFKVPAANLPTNIKGGAVGYFAGYDVRRFVYPVK